MLHSIKSCAPRFSRGGAVLIALVAVAAVALPAVHLLRTSSAAADDGAGGGIATSSLQTSDKTKSGEALVEYLPQPSAAEKKIIAALEQPTECNFMETPLADLVDYFRATHKVEIQIDAKALQDELIDSSVPVTRSLKDVSFRSALRIILGGVNLTYIIRDDVLVITTKSEADAFFFPRVYPVGDLVAGERDEAGFKTLLEAITKTVEMTSWDANGGAAAAKIVAPAKSIVISQTYGNHEKILELLRALHAAKAKQATGDKVDAERR